MNRIAAFEKVSFDEYLATRRKLFPYSEISDDDIRTEWENIKLPTRATQGSAGYDFFMPMDVTIWDDANVFFPTGIRCKIDPGWVLMLYPKSGLGSKYGTRLLNTTGVIDSDYYFSSNEGHIMCGMAISARKLDLKITDKFIQGVFVPYGITKDDNAVELRNGGFGSTGR